MLILNEYDEIDGEKNVVVLSENIFCYNAIFIAKTFWILYDYTIEIEVFIFCITDNEFLKVFFFNCFINWMKKEQNAAKYLFCSE